MAEAYTGFNDTIKSKLKMLELDKMNICKCASTCFYRRIQLWDIFCISVSSLLRSGNLFHLKPMGRLTGTK